MTIKMTNEALYLHFQQKNHNLSKFIGSLKIDFIFFGKNTKKGKDILILFELEV